MFTLEEATKSQRGSRCIALLFLQPQRYVSGGWSTPSPGRFNPGKDPVPILQEAGWAPGPAWTGAENLAPTCIRSPDRPSRSESLYRLTYPDPDFFCSYYYYYYYRIIFYSTAQTLCAWTLLRKFVSYFPCLSVIFCTHFRHLYSCLSYIFRGSQKDVF